jgi:hypothetical protein
MKLVKIQKISKPVAWMREVGLFKQRKGKESESHCQAFLYSFFSILNFAKGVKKRCGKNIKRIVDKFL